MMEQFLNPAITDSTSDLIHKAFSQTPAIFSERELTFTFSTCYRPSVGRLSVCLPSVMFVCPTQAVQIFRNISTALGTLAIH